MTDDRDSLPKSHQDETPDFDTNPFEKPRYQPPVEDEDDAYEEPERDTDYASAYPEDDFEDDDFEEATEEDVDDDESYEDELDDDEAYIDDEEESLIESDDTSDYDAEPENDDNWDEPEVIAAKPPQDWMKQADYADELIASAGQPFPLGLIAVAILAILLLAAGGYGVVQQRTATQEEIRQLRAALATAASPEDVSTSRAALQEVKQQNARLTVQIDGLTMENSRLTDTIAGLESQLEAQQAVTAKAARTSAVTSKVSAATSKPSAAAAKSPTAPATQSTSAATAGGGAWFVNFGSYGQRAAAQEWQTKLRPVSGKTVVTTSEKNGKTFYRVRVIELANQESAEKVARALEDDYGLSKLWVGKE